MKFYQACYGKPNNTSWQLFNESPDIPMNIREFFEKIGNRNAPQNIPRNVLTDESGNNKTVQTFEIASSEEGLCVAQNLYEAHNLDVQGRRAMFMQGFLFRNNDGILEDPNNLLSISDENFKFGVEETSDIPTELVRDKYYNIEDAISVCGVSKEFFEKLMACIYTIISGTTDSILYIKSDGVNEIMKPMIYCIYTAMPYSLRHMISFSNIVTTVRSQNKIVVFTEEVISEGLFFDLGTAQTNVVLDDIIQHPEKYPFYEQLKVYGIENYKSYCDSLKEVLNSLQITNTQKFNALRFADTILRGTDYLKKLSEQDITRALLEMMMYAPMSNSYADDFLAEVLNIFATGGSIPNEALMQRLRARAEKTTSKLFADIYNKLEVKTLLSKGEAAAVTFLIKQRSIGIENFQKWVNIVEACDDGETIVNNYYITVIEKCESLTMLESVFAGCGKYSENEKLLNAVYQRAFVITKNNLNRQALVFADVLEQYSKFIAKYFAGVAHQNIIKNIEALSEYYWEHYNFKAFEFSEHTISNYVCVECKENETYKNVKYLINIYRLIEEDSGLDDRLLIGKIERQLSVIEKESTFTLQQFKEIVPIVQEYVLNQLSRLKRGHLIFWCNIADFGAGNGVEKNPYELMMEWDLPVLWDDSDFEAALDSQRVERYLSDLIYEIEGDDKDGYLYDFEQKSEEFRLLQRRLNSLKKLKKDLHKMQKKEEKEKRKRERDYESASRRYDADESTDNPRKKTFLGKFKK